MCYGCLEFVLLWNNGLISESDERRSRWISFVHVDLQSYYFLAIKRLLVSFVLVPLIIDPKSTRTKANGNFFSFKACCEWVYSPSCYWAVIPSLPLQVLSCLSFKTYQFLYLSFVCQVRRHSGYIFPSGRKLIIHLHLEEVLSECWKGSSSELS